MNPRLVMIAGAEKGLTIPLEGAPVTVGREPTNSICLSDAAASRRHCRLEMREGEVWLRDLESRNGVFINGIPVTERQLRSGDQVKIGSSLFLFLTEEEAAGPHPERVEFENHTQVIRLGISQEMALPPLQSSALTVLWKVCSAINSTTGVSALEQKLLDVIFEIVPAERGSILILGRDSTDFISVFGRERGSAGNVTVQVSRRIIDMVLREGRPFLSNDLTNSPVSSVLAVPLTVFNEVRGVIYLDSANRSASFGEELIPVFSVIGGIAATALESARRLEWLENENRRLQEEIAIEHNMIGESPRMKAIHRFIGRAAPTNATVLITGESGTGKELVARAIHLNSARSQQPFVAINCAAISDNLLESELFGHERGAFSGAVSLKKGKFEIADNGTIFLDEIGELAPLLQAKLLRVLQEQEFERVGGTRPIRVDIRVVAATNRDLPSMVSAGTFRGDLYFRLNVVSVAMPPLRERREDIPLLANHFAAKYSARVKRRVLGISPEALVRLQRYDWPGNVRELENAIERAVVLGSSEEVLPDDLPEVIFDHEGGEAAAGGAHFHESVAEHKKKIILDAVDHARGNFVEAARHLGLHPNYLHRLVRQFNLKPAIRRASS